MIRIGHDYIDANTGDRVRCLDTDKTGQCSQIGVVDERGVINNKRWVMDNKLVKIIKKGSKND
jgi:hypothetical protein